MNNNAKVEITFNTILCEPTECGCGAGSVRGDPPPSSARLPPPLPSLGYAPVCVCEPTECNCGTSSVRGDPPPSSSRLPPHPLPSLGYAPVCVSRQNVAVAQVLCVVTLRPPPPHPPAVCGVYSQHKLSLLPRAPHGLLRTPHGLSRALKGSDS